MTRKSQSPAGNANKATKPVISAVKKTPAATKTRATKDVAEVAATRKLPGDSFPAAVWETITKGIEQGTPLREICREDGMPSYGTVYDRIEADSEFASRFARARERGHDAIADQCVAIADEEAAIINHPDEGEVEIKFDAAAVARNRLRVETRLKLLAKWNPKKYGEKLEIESNHTVRDDTDSKLMKRLGEYGVMVTAIVPTAPEGGDAG